VNDTIKELLYCCYI